MSEKIIELQNIEKYFAGVHALDDVSLNIEKGEVRCLAGENGSGKSTLIKIIAGVYKRDGGNIRINGRDYPTIHPIDSIREGIHVIYQDFSLYPNLSVAENLSINTQIEKNKKFINWKHCKQIANRALEEIDVHIDLEELVMNLSVADKQLVEISRALWHEAKLIIMDEPTTALTQKEVDSLFRVIKRMQGDGISTLFVSHKLREVTEISEKITILRNGKKVADGNVSDFDEKKITYYMTGREVSNSRYEFDLSKRKNDFLTVKNLSRENVYKNISFELKKGEILGITGLLGSGRTDLALSLMGIKPYTSGEIFINKQKQNIRNINDAISCGFGYVSEDRLTTGIFDEQSVSRNIFISTIDDFLDFFGFIDSNKIDHEVSRWIEELSIATSSFDIPVKSLSGGNQQKVVLARWLATQAKVLILNGPTVGVDIGSKMDIHEKLRKLARAGLSIILISDDIPEILQTCVRIFIMHRGEIVHTMDAHDSTEKTVAEYLSKLK